MDGIEAAAAREDLVDGAGVGDMMSAAASMRPERVRRPRDDDVP